MSIYRRRYQAIVAAFWLALMLGIWFLFAPLQVGGQAAYVIVAGQSMEPNLYLGDLVIVHQGSSYQVGDVVAYQNADIDRLVIHRVIDEKQGRFLLQGDNNTWIDSFKPARQEILGRLWVHLPKFGLYMQKLREPIYMALIAGLIGSMISVSFFVSKQREKQPMEVNSRRTELNIRKGFARLVQNINLRKVLENFSSTRSQTPEPEPNKGQDRNTTETWFFALAVIALLSFLLGIISFTRPATQMVSDDVNYQHLGFFSYTAAAPAGVYDAATIQSGEPIFPKLTCSIDITFNYTLVAAPAENIAGSYQLIAVLTHPQSGWQRTFPLQEQAPFIGNTFDTQAILNLCEIVRLIESVEELTDSRAGTYTLSVSPRIHATGSVAGRPLESTFEPELIFQYDRTQFYVANQSEGADPLNPSEANILHEEKHVPNTVSFFGAELNVPILRTIAMIGLVLSLSGMALLWLQLENVSRNDPDTFMRIKYAPFIIDVEEGNLRNAARVIAVSTIDDLARLAEKHNTMILHAVQDNFEYYLVHVSEISYVYSRDKGQLETITASTDNSQAESTHKKTTGSTKSRKKAGK